MKIIKSKRKKLISWKSGLYSIAWKWLKYPQMKVYATKWHGLDKYLK